MSEPTTNGTNARAPVADPLRTYALVVGIEHYEAGRTWELDGPASDAARFTRWLAVERGVPPSQIFLFLSPLDPEAPRAILPPGTSFLPADGKGIRDALTKTLPTCRGDLLWVFWAGHGVLTREGSRRLFLADASLQDKRNVNLTSLLTALRSGPYAGLRQHVVVVDACQNYVERLQYAHTLPNDEFAYGVPLPEWEQFVLYAASPGQVAKNLGRLHSGAFSEALMQELRDAPKGVWPPDMQGTADRLEARFRELKAAGKAEQVPTRFHYVNWGGGERDISGAPAVELVDDLRRILETALSGPSIVGPWEVEASFICGERGTEVRKLGFSPDGALLATTGTDGSMRLFDVGRNRSASEAVSLGTTYVHDFQFSADDRRLVVVAGGAAAMWRVPDLGEPVWKDEGQYILDFSVSPDGRLVALGRGPDESAVWDVDKQSVIQQLDPHVFRVDFSPDGTRLVTWSMTAGIVLWELGSDGFRRTTVPVDVPEEEKVKYIAFSSSGRLIISVTETEMLGDGFPRKSNTVYVNEPAKGTRIGSIADLGTVTAVAASEDDELLAISSNDGTVRIWPVGKRIEPVRIQAGGLVRGVGFGPHRSFVAIASKSTNVSVWHLADDGGPDSLVKKDVLALAVCRQGRIATAHGRVAFVWAHSV